MEPASPEDTDWRLKDSSGNSITLPPTNPQWVFDHGKPEVREAWINNCLAAVDAGCGGCFIDRAYKMGQFPGFSMTAAQSNDFKAAHQATLDELDEKLALRGKFAIAANNAVQTQHRVMMMVEDFAAREQCIERLQVISQRGIGAIVKAGQYPTGGANQCVNGDINSMAVFLIGMGENMFYHCARVFQSNPGWPNVADWWLDWLPEYDYPLGEPAGPGVKGADGVWRRSFESGTTAEFDTGSGIGTIKWKEANGNVVTQVGIAATVVSNANQGCRWQTMS